MKLGFDLRAIASGKNTGVEEYTLNILAGLLDLNTDISIFYNSFFGKLDKNFIKRRNISLYEFNVPNKLLDIFLMMQQPKLDKLIDVDVFFSPHFLSAPISPNAKKITVFHDLSFLHYPEFFSLRKKYWHFMQNPKKQAEKSDKIIAISESTKNDLIDFYDISEDKISVIYSGVGGNFKIISPDNPNLKRVRKKYNLPSKFILYLGTIEPRKNIEGIIKAFEILRKKRDIKLVIAGDSGWLYNDIFNLAKHSRFSNDIIFTGFIDQKDKLYLYNLAEVFVYPSFFEGFGFPPLEAMACGVPVVVSNSSSLPEVVSEAGIMVDPYKIDEIFLGIDVILNDDNLKNKLIKEGLKRASEFSWQKTARETLNLIKNIG